MESSGTIEKVDDFLSHIQEHTSNWAYTTRAAKPWYRGQQNANHAPLPSIFRHRYEEVGLTLMFRERAPVYGAVPGRTGNIDQWLFLMQHYGAPTRLLDWTESAMAGLFFAVFNNKNKDKPGDDYDAVVWMLHPLELNKLDDAIGKYEFPNTWSDHKGNIVRENLARPFGLGKNATKYPIAIQTTYSRPLMSSQKSCFTIHGTIEEDFETMFSGTKLEKEGYFRKYTIPFERKAEIEKELDVLGFTYSTVFPNLSGLALELKYRFRKDVD